MSAPLPESFQSFSHSQPGWARTRTKARDPPSPQWELLVRGSAACCVRPSAPGAATTASSPASRATSACAGGASAAAPTASWWWTVSGLWPPRWPCVASRPWRPWRPPLLRVRVPLAPTAARARTRSPPHHRHQRIRRRDLALAPATLPHPHPQRRHYHQRPRDRPWWPRRGSTSSGCAACSSPRSTSPPPWKVSSLRSI